MAFEMALGLDGKSNTIYFAIGSFILISSFANKCISKTNNLLHKSKAHVKWFFLSEFKIREYKLSYTDEGSSNSTNPTKLRFNQVSE